MTSRTRIRNHKVFGASVSVLAISCMAAFSTITIVATISAEPAFAAGGGNTGGSGRSGGSGGSGGSDHSDDHSHDDSSHSGGFKGKKAGGGSSGHSDGGHDDGGHDDDGHDDSSHAGGKGGPGAESEGRGLQYGKQTDRTGGRPPWAQEGIPEIELGRLNVARSPSHVLDRAYLEALASFTPDKVAFYNMSIDEAAAALRADFRDVSMIDSPLQNLSLLRDILEDGQSVLNTLDEVQNDSLTLAAIFLGTASDKSMEIVPETAYALSIILGYELTEGQANALANDAEIIRAAIKDGHG